MADIPGQDSLDAILLALQHERDRVRYQALDRLRTFAYAAKRDEEEEALPPTNIDQLWDNDPARIYQRKRVVEALLTALKDPSARIRAYVAVLLWKVKTLEVQSALLRHLRNDPSDFVRRSCAIGLQWNPDSPQRREGLIAALHDPSRDVLVPVIQALGKLGDTEAVAPLHTVLKHPSWDVRFRACETLVHLRAVDQDVVHLLEELNQGAEAEEYNQMATSLDEQLEDLDMRLRKEYGLAEPTEPEPDAHMETTHAVLEQARRLLR